LPTKASTRAYLNDAAGMVKMMDNDEEMGPINIGNPTEFTMLELAKVEPAFRRGFCMSS
jgi:hypothetical protein